MKRIKVEKMSLADTPEFADWTAKLSHRNNVDAGVFEYPTLEVLKASNGKGISYVPFQTTWFLEALAFNPEATPQEKSVALRETFTVIEFEARCQGIREIYFLCADVETKWFCVRHHFDVMTPRVVLASSYASEGYPDTSNTEMQLFRRKI